MNLVESSLVESLPSDDLSHVARFQGLDAWRGIAATGVTFFHLTVYSDLSTLGVIQHAWIFVDFFFVLSGFVISHAYLERLRVGGWCRQFILRRLARLWPLHVVMLVLFICFEALMSLAVAMHVAAPQPLFSAETGTSWRSVVDNLLLIQGLGLERTNTWNGVSWSISAEFWTYLVFAGLCATGSRRAIAFGGAVLATASTIVIWRCSPHVMNSSHDFGFFRCLYGFFVGQCVYLIGKAWRPRRILGTVVEFLVFSLIVVFVSAVDPDPWSLIAPPLFGVATWVFANEIGCLSELLRMRPFQQLGKWSYSIYMVHLMLAHVLEKSLSFASRWLPSIRWVPLTYVAGFPSEDYFRLRSMWANDAIAFAYYVCVVATASLAYNWIELPGKRMIGSLLKAHPVEMRRA